MHIGASWEGRLYSVALVGAGSVVYPPGGKYGPRVQPFYQLVLLHKGELQVWSEDQHYTMKPGHVMLLRPNRKDRFEFSRTEETWHRWINVKLDGSPSGGETPFDRLPVQLKISDTMNQFVDLLLMLNQMSGEKDSDIRKSVGLAALFAYKHEHETAMAAHHAHPSVRLAKSYIASYYAHDIDLSDIASAVHMSRHHLVRLFRQTEGVTPMEYVWRYRTEKGIELLRNTGLMVSEASDHCGFKNAHHFARKVKQYTGKTPSEVREP